MCVCVCVSNPVSLFRSSACLLAVVVSDTFFFIFYLALIRSLIMASLS